MEVDAQIKHSLRKLHNAQKMQEQVGNDAERQQAKLNGLLRDLTNARQAADQAAGTPFTSALSTVSSRFCAQRLTDVHLNITFRSARPV